MVDTRLVEGQVLLLHLDSGAYHELNPVGAEIWSLVDGARTVTEITAELRERLEDPPDDLETVVEQYLTELRERSLIL